MKRPSKEEVEREIAALDDLDTKALKEKWESVYRREPPPKIRAKLLRLGIAYRLQERAFGGLKPQTIRQLKKLATELREERAARKPGTSITPVLAAGRHLGLGTRLMREWNGAMEMVEVVADGFEWRGKTFRTLTAAACAITGTKWSGPKFFGLAAPPVHRASGAAAALATGLEVAP